MNDHITEWFEENYIELDARDIIEKAVLKHDCTVNGLYESCRVLKEMFPEKSSLTFQLKYLVAMADNGITGTIAGEQLATYFSLRKIFKH